MKKPIIKITLSIIVLALVFKCARELFWVARDRAEINNELIVNVSCDQSLDGFQDHDHYKYVTVINKNTKAYLNINFISLESSLFFFVDTLNGRKVLRIADLFVGQNVYDYESLTIIHGEKDTLSEEGLGIGFSQKTLWALGNSVLVFNGNTFE